MVTYTTNFTYTWNAVLVLIVLIFRRQFYSKLCLFLFYETLSVFRLSIQCFSGQNFNRIIAADSGAIPLHEYAGERSCDRVTAKHCVSLSSAVSWNDVSF